MGTIRDNVRRNLGYYLTLNGISQKELAERLGVSQSAVSNWIKGYNSPDIEVAAEICNILNITISDLFGVNDTENESKYRFAIIKQYSKLNATGRKKADEYITDLSENPKYTEPGPLDEVSKDISRELSQITGTTAKRSTTSK